MPHKHKRDKGKDDASYYDLPPSKSAQSLPVKRSITPHTNQPHTKPTKRKNARIEDDTPRAFTRLLTAYRPPRSGLDDGVRPSKKRKTSKPPTELTTIAPSPSIPTPVIQAGEPLSSFNARVDAALPFSGLSKRSGGGKDAEKGRKTKTERKMQKMQREWREEERRRKEKLEEREDEDLVEEDAVNDMVKGATKSKRKERKAGTRGGPENEAGLSDDNDPWAHIKAKRLDEGLEKTTGGLVGIHDVVLAPPKFSKLPKGKDFSKAVRGPGGLKKRAELSEARQSVIDGYRRMMKEKQARGE